MAEGDLRVSLLLRGGRELSAMLQALGKVPAGRIGSAAVTAGAQVFAEKMKTNIAARGLVLSGKLIESIKVTEDLDVRKAGIGWRQAYAGSSLWYAKFSEFGTVRQAAKPWARPAVDEGANEAVAVTATVLASGIEAEAMKLSKSLQTSMAALRASRRDLVPCQSLRASRYR